MAKSNHDRINKVMDALKTVLGRIFVLKDTE